MKIIYIKNDGGSFFEELKNEIQIGGINLLFVDGKRRIDDASKADRKDSEHIFRQNKSRKLSNIRDLSMYIYSLFAASYSIYSLICILHSHNHFTANCNSKGKTEDCYLPFFPIRF